MDARVENELTWLKGLKSNHDVVELGFWQSQRAVAGDPAFPVPRLLFGLPGRTGGTAVLTARVVRPSRGTTAR